MKDILSGVSISGISCAVPDHIVMTEEYNARYGEDAVKKYISSVGIKQRYVVAENTIVTTADLCCAAAEKLIEELNINRESIDGLIFLTQHPDYPTSPATACVLQYRLGLDQECMAYDVNQGCTGYLYGLYLAASHLQSGHLKRILLLVGDAMHRISPEDRSMSMLFGDAGSATILEYNENAEEIQVTLETLGGGFRTIVTPCGGARHPEGNRERVYREEGIVRSDFDGSMDGTGVFNFTIKEVPRLFKKFEDKFETDRSKYSCFVFHQANLYLLKYLAKKCKIPVEKMPLSIEKYGNTSSASIPVTLCNCREQYDFSKTLMVSFGVGLSLGIVSADLKNTKILPIIYTNQSFEDGLI